MTISAFALLVLFGIVAGMVPVACFLPIALWSSRRRFDAEDLVRIASERRRRISWQLDAEHDFWLQQKSDDAWARDVASYRAWKAQGGAA